MNQWENLTTLKGYTFWSLKLENGKTIYNVTEEEKTPPSNESGYFSLYAIMGLKNIPYTLQREYFLTHDQK